MCTSKARQRIAVDMRQLVDEHQRAVKSERRDETAEQRESWIRRQNRARHSGVADQRRAGHVRPVDRPARFAEILGQIPRRAQHRLVVRDTRAPNHRRGVARECYGIDGLVRVHGPINPMAPYTTTARRDRAKARHYGAA